MGNEQPEWTRCKSLIFSPGAEALEIELSWCFASRMLHSKISVSKLNKIHIMYAKVRSSLWIFMYA